MEFIRIAVYSGWHGNTDVMPHNSQYGFVWHAYEKPLHSSFCTDMLRQREIMPLYFTSSSTLGFACNVWLFILDVWSENICSATGHLLPKLELVLNHAWHSLSKRWCFTDALIWKQNLHSKKELPLQFQDTLWKQILFHLIQNLKSHRTFGTKRLFVEIKCLILFFFHLCFWINFLESSLACIQVSFSMSTKQESKIQVFLKKIK